MRSRLAPLAAMLAIASLVCGSLAAQAAPAPAGADGPYVIGAVGDIACKNPPGNNRRVCQYDNVSELIYGTGLDAFLPLGDVQYEYGELDNFRENYDVYFGDALGFTRPVPGNHDYGTAGAAGYYTYFGSIAHGPGGYYSWDLGGWHFIALNSAICPAAIGCGPGHPQYEWLKADLAAHPNSQNRCTVAYWHHPRYDWLKYQNADWTEDYEWLRTKPFWDLLYRKGADVVLAGHNHNYSRWLPMDDALDYDPDGIVQFIVGTGGRNLNDLGSPSTQPLTFARGQSRSFGILRMTLKDGAFDYRYATAPGSPDFIDADRNVACH